MPMHGWYGGFGWLWMILGTILTLAVLSGLIVLIVWAIRRAGGNPTGLYGASSGQSQPTAKDILQVRYARGEISSEQYQQMLAEIER